MRTEERELRTATGGRAWMLLAVPRIGPAKVVRDVSGRPVVWRDYAAMQNARTWMGRHGRRGLRRMGWRLSDDGRGNVLKAALLAVAAIATAALSGCANMCPGCWE